ncbi:MAG: hypothetical protein OHK0038_24340 [Flammeovirgaceae bacterium]
MDRNVAHNSLLYVALNRYVSGLLAKTYSISGKIIDDKSMLTDYIVEFNNFTIGISTNKNAKIITFYSDKFRRLHCKTK